MNIGSRGCFYTPSLINLFFNITNNLVFYVFYLFIYVVFMSKIII